MHRKNKNKNRVNTEYARREGSGGRGGEWRGVEGGEGSGVDFTGYFNFTFGLSYV